MSTLRQRKHTLKVVQELDAFPKVPDGYQETTATGGGMSLLVFALIAILVVSEVRYYTTKRLKFNFDVDPDFDGKLKLNLDMTIAMRCEHVGADVLDLTGQNAETFGQLNEENVYFELSPKQKRYFDRVKAINEYMRNEYHSVHEFLWTTGFNSVSSPMPAREDKPPGEFDACRFHGSLLVNKVAGNFHITAGKSVPVFPRGHAHLSMLLRESDYNFTHRINHFSFGVPTPGIVNPLEGEEKITDERNQMYQYFIQVVPTLVDTSFATTSTYQYAVTENSRNVDHHKGSHGVPGIFVKYDLSSLRVHVSEDHESYWQFIVRLCGIVGGIFATSGILHAIVSSLVDVMCCRMKWTEPRRPSAVAADNHHHMHSPTLTAPPNPDHSPTTALYSDDGPLLTGSSLLSATDSDGWVEPNNSAVYS